MDDKVVIKALEKVKKRLTNHGWHKGWGNYSNPVASTCIVGAVRGEVGHEESPLGKPVIQALNAARLNYSKVKFQGVIKRGDTQNLMAPGYLIQHNDTKGVRKEHIIAMINKAMKLVSGKPTVDRRIMAKVIAVQVTPNGHLKINAKHKGKELSVTLNFQEWPEIKCEKYENYVPQKISVSKEGMIHVTLSSFSMRVDLKKHKDAVDKMAERAFERLDNVKKNVPVISKALELRLKGKMYVAPKTSQSKSINLEKSSGITLPPMKIPSLV